MADVKLTREQAVGALIQAIVEKPGQVTNASLGEFSDGGWYWDVMKTQGFGNTASVMHGAPLLAYSIAEATVIALRALEKADAKAAERVSA